jgi:hypothetical protein
MGVGDPDVSRDQGLESYNLLSQLTPRPKQRLTADGRERRGGRGTGWATEAEERGKVAR